MKKRPQNSEPISNERVNTSQDTEPDESSSGPPQPRGQPRCYQILLCSLIALVVTGTVTLTIMAVITKHSAIPLIVLTSTLTITLRTLIRALEKENLTKLANREKKSGIPKYLRPDAVKNNGLSKVYAAVVKSFGKK